MKSNELKPQPNKNLEELKYSAIGLMAGSSMDGLDIVHVTFQKEYDNWEYVIGSGVTVPYPNVMLNKLSSSASMTLKEQQALDIEFGEWIGETVRNHLSQNEISADLLSVHGHTVIHQPENNISWQLGSGEKIRDITGISTIVDFRTKDISLGGQGAPLVPMGDFQLFKEYDACLNLGGIANISLKKNQSAWDITPCNQILNYYAKQLGREYDENGAFSREGTMDADFLELIRQNEFFKKSPPKSLPNQFIGEEILNTLPPKNGLRSMTEFIAAQIASDVDGISLSKPRMLVTGGGTHNQFLVERINHHLPNWNIIIPTKQIVDFKEAIVFAFLGVLKLRNEVNVLASVTGASKDSSSGVIHFAK